MHAAPLLTLLPGARHRLPDARRSTPDEIAREVRAATENQVVGALLDALDAAVLVLGSRRQVVAANGAALAGASVDDVVGLRPGEALACASAAGGCGTSRACETCGALGAILASRAERRPVQAECLLRRQDGAPLELAVRATPVLLGGAAFTVLSLRDVSAEKRRDAFEQIFFHDVLNTVSGLRGWAARLARALDPARSRAAAERIDVLSRRIEREIADHRALARAERGERVAVPAPVEVAELLEELETVFASHACAEGRRLRVLPPPAGARLETDRSLLLRVLVNLTKNALEASPEGAEVEVACAPHAPSGGLRFTVRNEGVIPADVQVRIFQRSFSTKAARGRGLGTWSVKLLGEGQLGGAVGFSSSAGAGTAFWITVLAAPPSPLAPAGAS